MLRLVTIFCACLTTVAAFCQSGSKWQVGTITEVKIHQTAEKDRASDNASFDVSLKVGDTIYLTYSVHPKAPGTVTVKWYTNNNLYEESKPIPVADAVSGYVPIQYSQAAEGMVELYWNDQLAMRLYFVVEPNMS